MWFLVEPKTEQGMTKRVATRIEQVQDPVIPIVGALIADHPGTISLGQGIVHYAPPPNATDAMQKVCTTHHRYGDVQGTSPLRSLLKEKLLEENQIPTDDCDVVYTAGSNMGFLNAILAIADIGDEIVIQSPYYFNHEMAIAIAGCKAVVVATTSDYQLDLDTIQKSITSRTRAVVTISPNNPTGAVYSRDALTRINQLCREREIFHISDEAYEYFTYDSAEHFSPASLPGASPHTISLYTLSKAYGLAGWRCGYMVVPDDLLMAVKKIQDTNLVCPPMLNQDVAAAALQAGREWVQPHVRSLEQVRNEILDEFDALPGCRVPRPGGAFYTLLQLDTDRGDMELVRELISRFGVATLPGSTFGVETGCQIRVSYGALKADSVIEGIGRLKKGLRALL